MPQWQLHNIWKYQINILKTLKLTQCYVSNIFKNKTKWKKGCCPLCNTPLIPAEFNLSLLPSTCVLYVFMLIAPIHPLLPMQINSYFWVKLFCLNITVPASLFFFKRKFFICIKTTYVSRIPEMMLICQLL